MWPFVKKAQPVPTDAPTQPQILHLRNGTAAMVIQWNEAIQMTQAMRHPIVYRVLDKIATSVQQLRWIVKVDTNASAVDQRGKETFIRELGGLLATPNGSMSAPMLRYWMALNYAGYGRVPLKISFAAMDQKKPNGIYPLDTRYVKVTQNDRGVPIRYAYGTGTESVTYPSKQSANAGASFVEQIWKPGLSGFMNKDDHNTPLGAVGLPAEVIRLLLVRALETASGRPNVRYLVTCGKTLTPDQLQSLSEHLNKDYAVGSGEDSGGIPVLQNVPDFKIHELKNDLSDIHSKMPSDDMARLIYGAFGIPIALAGMGAADAAKFAGNYIESRQSFWEDTVIPGYASPLFEGLTKLLCPPGVVITPDYDSVPALVHGRMLSMRNAASVPFLTTNEKRDMFGFEPTDEIPATSTSAQTEGSSDDE